MALTFYTGDFFLITYAADNRHASGLMKDDKEFTWGFPATCFFHRKRAFAATTLSCQCTLTRVSLCVPEVHWPCGTETGHEVPVPTVGCCYQCVG